ncbi:MAG: methylenetetrahydrofolate reductase C-terminal domain-containing protein [Desulfosudaceae bacterium]
MIVADRKPLEELLAMIAPFSRIMLVGCKGCVTVCNVGGTKEVEVLASALNIARKKEGAAIQIDTRVLERQCDPEYVEQLRPDVADYEAIFSMACGVGPQFLSEAYPEQRFFPAVDTTFYGGAVSHGVWEERCAGCGACLIHHFDGLCPIARCAKSLLHGPCGGSADGVCEVSRETECVWDAIVKKKMAAGRLEDLLQIREARDWRAARDGGPRRSIREELIQNE